MPSKPGVILPQKFATCTPNPVWNALKGADGEGPCDVAKSLLLHNGKNCTSMSIPLALDGNFPDRARPYTGPSNAAEATPCACSYEVYNAYSACAACQSQDNHNDTVTENWVTYKKWLTHCDNSTSESTTYPFSIDPSFPAWVSRLPPGVYGRFSIHKALGTVVNGDLKIHTLSSNNSKSHVNSRRIVGGIMGGIIGILALCLLLWILGRRTRRNRRIPPSSPWLGPPFPSQPPPRLLPITISKYDRDRMSERPVVSAGAPGRVSEQNPTLRQEDEVRSLGARLLAFMRTQRHSSQSAWSQAPPAYPQP